MQNELIRLVQLPVIEEQLRAVKTEVDRSVEQALSLVCTEDTLQSVKDTRANLTKQFNELEERRKALKKEIMAPYERFETVYKECVSDAFRRADTELKGRIAEVEGTIKQACEDRLREYFDELCAAERVTFLRFEQVGLKIGLADARSKSANRLREQIAVFVTGISEGVQMISKMDNADEIMVEYKKSLDIAKAISTVQERHKRIEEEKAAQAERKAAQERVEAAIDKVYAVAPPVTVEPPKPAEKEVKCVFTVRATVEKLKKLKEFMNQEGIKYE